MVVARQVGFVKLEDLGVLWKYANVHTQKNRQKLTATRNFTKSSTSEHFIVE